MAGLIPTEAQYGDQTALRRLGMKASPETGAPTFFNPQGGRPPQVPQAGVPVLSGNQQALPPASDIEAEHQSLYQRAADLVSAARAWQQLADSTLSTPKIVQTARALREAAKLALYDARNKTPYVKGF